MFGLSWIRARSACKESVMEVELVVIYPDVVKAVMTMDGFVGERKYEERKYSRNGTPRKKQNDKK